VNKKGKKGKVCFRGGGVVQPRGGFGLEGGRGGGGGGGKVSLDFFKWSWGKKRGVVLGKKGKRIQSCSPEDWEKKEKWFSCVLWKKLKKKEKKDKFTCIIKRTHLCGGGEKGEGKTIWYMEAEEDEAILRKKM